MLDKMELEAEEPEQWADVDDETTMNTAEDHRLCASVKCQVVRFELVLKEQPTTVARFFT